MDSENGFALSLELQSLRDQVRTVAFTEAELLVKR